MIEGLLTPPNVRTHESYWEEMDFSKAREWYEDEIEGFDNVVLMGVPGEEVESYTDFASEALQSEAFSDADIYAHEEEGEALEGFDYEEISYESMPSRIGDVEWMNEVIPEDENVAVLSMDYNTRTGFEVDRRMESHDTFGQFALNFDDFNSFSTGRYLKNKLPLTETFQNETEDEGKSFEYDVPEVEGEAAVVLNVPFSTEIEDYDSKMRTEAFRHGLARLPYGQRMKDIGKRVVNWFR
ncbi:MAG: hypothetical protein ABEK04_04015 [Candidatus Nanohalobium sp.]